MDSIEEVKKKVAKKKKVESSSGPATFKLEDVLGGDRQLHSESVAIAQNIWDMSKKPSQEQSELIKKLLRGYHDFRYTLVATKKAATNSMVKPLVSFVLDEPWNEAREWTLCEVKSEAYIYRNEIPSDEHLFRDIRQKAL